MIEEPLVTINILSFNRRDELRNTLTKVYEQDYKNIEVIVVDNASSDGSAEMVKNEFSSVKLIQMEKNIGIAGWNEGFKVAKGEYVLVLDDDSYPDINSIKEAVNCFYKDNRLGIVAYGVYNKRINKYETEDFDKIPKLFIGCGALITKLLLNQIGFYNEQYFIYLHELDFSARCYDAGFNILYLPLSLVYHNQSLLSRGKENQDPFLSEYRFKYHFINYTIFLVQNFSLYYIILYLPKWIFNRTIICVKYYYLNGYLFSIFYLWRNFFDIYKKRQILTKPIQKFYNYGNIPFIDKNYF